MRRKKGRTCAGKIKRKKREKRGTDKDKGKTKKRVRGEEQNKKMRQDTEDGQFMTSGEKQNEDFRSEQTVDEDSRVAEDGEKKETRGQTRIRNSLGFRKED